MPDVFTRAKRSDVMSRIRSRGNKDTELALMRIFRAHRITGWRRHVEVRIKKESTSPRPSPQSGEGEAFRVRPDFIFPKLKVAVFVDGCFWHCCPLHATQPRNNAAFWQKKLASNQARDRLVRRVLQRAGWRVLRLWEHELVRRHEARMLKRIQKALAASSNVKGCWSVFRKTLAGR